MGPKFEPEIEILPDPLTEDTMVRSVEQNERLDGVPLGQGDYTAVRRNVGAAWRKRMEDPYFNEVEVFFEGEEKEESSPKTTPTKDYWVLMGTTMCFKGIMSFGGKHCLIQYKVKICQCLCVR